MSRYPQAIIAAYGPDATLATKLVVSVITRDEHEPAQARTWLHDSADVRRDPVIAAEVSDFLRRHRVVESVYTDGIIGCPHQEGIDYPMGRVCPRCPYWATIDRFTREPLTVPAPTMSPAEILDALSKSRTTHPREALASARAHRDALVEPLLAALDRGIADPSGVTDEEGNLFSYALYLVALWRETRAYEPVCRWLSLPEEEPFDVGGDIVTEDGGRILAAVCDGDLEPLKRLATNQDADEYGRSMAIMAMSLLAAWGEVPRESVVECFAWLAREGLEREPSHVWDTLAGESVDIEALEIFPDLRRAYDAGFIDPQFMAASELDAAETEPRGLRLDETRERYPPIRDVEEATSWWSCYAQRKSSKVGRNDPCPCGSGKKYKKCCGR